MVANRLSDEKITELIAEGWNFHIKKSSKYRYIVRRKKQAMISLGKFDEQYWNRILRLIYSFNQTKKEASTIESEDREERRKFHRRIDNAKKNLIRSVQIDRSQFIASTCDFVEDGFCIKWEYTMETPVFGYIKDTFKPGIETNRKIINDKGEKIWHLRAGATYCTNCSEYKSILGKKHIKSKWYLQIRDE